MSNSILLFFSLFFISSTSFSVPFANTTHRCSIQQSLALLQFKHHLSSINSSIDVTQYFQCENCLGSGYNPILINWNTSTDCCDWTGVTCDHSTGNVISLDLSCGMLQGTIHPNTTLFHLPYLQKLNLACNNFTDSQLPAHINKVSNSLTHLNLSSCGFTGQVPAGISLLHKLVSLDLSLNGNENGIDLNLEPHVFYNLLQNSTVIKELYLNGVDIFELPTNINISSSLKLLNLGSTGLLGNIPHSIFNLQSLETLDLSDNSFTGHIPAEITLLPKLGSLDLSYNGRSCLLIQPHIFSILLTNSTFLRDLNLQEVNIGFVLPTHLNISSPLRSLSLGSTNLQGKLPHNILNLKYLEELHLSRNNVSGPLPEVNTSTSIPLMTLDLSETNISGGIPTSIGHLNSLTHLYLSQTSLSGGIPTSIGHLNSLIYLDISYCGLNGSLPKSIGNLRYLESLYLSSNMLSGTLPSSLFTLHALKSIYLDNNMFQGNMAPELFFLKSLESLNIANNQLTGQIDVLNNGHIQKTFQQLTNLTSLDLSYNDFIGEWELDTLLSSLKNLDTLILSFSGISVTTNNAHHYVNPNLRTLRMASCSLKVFPATIRSMKTLRYLDLSSNDIQGHIPDWLQEIGVLVSVDILMK